MAAEAAAFRQLLQAQAGALATQPAGLATRMTMLLLLLRLLAPLEPQPAGTHMRWDESPGSRLRCRRCRQRYCRLLHLQPQQSAQAAARRLGRLLALHRGEQPARAACGEKLLLELLLRQQQ